MRQTQARSTFAFAGRPRGPSSGHRSLGIAGLRSVERDLASDKRRGLANEQDASVQVHVRPAQAQCFPTTEATEGGVRERGLVRLGSRVEDAGDLLRGRRVQPLACEPRQADDAGTDIVSYLTESQGFSAFTRDDGAVYHTNSTGDRGVEFLMDYYPILDRAPKGGDEGDGFQLWIRPHDKYDNA